MVNSPLVVFTRISSFKNTPRNAAITKITPHHMAGNLTVESCAQVFQGVVNHNNYDYRHYVGFGISALYCARNFYDGRVGGHYLLFHAPG
jgi:hypothetical protein